MRSLKIYFFLAANLFQGTTQYLFFRAYKIHCVLPMFRISIGGRWKPSSILSLYSCPRTCNCGCMGVIVYVAKLPLRFWLLRWFWPLRWLRQPEAANTFRSRSHKDSPLLSRQNKIKGQGGKNQNSKSRAVT